MPGRSHLPKIASSRRAVTVPTTLRHDREADVVRARLLAMILRNEAARKQAPKPSP